MKTQYNIFHLRSDAKLITKEVRTIGTGTFDFFVVGIDKVEKKVLEMLDDDHFAVQYQNSFKRFEYPSTYKNSFRTICESWIEKDLRLEKLKAIR